MTAIIPAPVHMVEAVAALRFPAVTDRRLQILMDRNNDGTLTNEEREKLAALAELSETIALVPRGCVSPAGRTPQ